MLEKILTEFAELKAITLLSAKKALNLDEASLMTGLSKSCMYKKTHKREIPFYKANNGKYLYFDRDELNSWMLCNRIKTNDELEAEAISYCVTGKKFAK